MPAADTFGFDFLEWSPERATVAMPPAHAMVQVERVLHGGAIAALADTAAVYLLLPELEDGQSMTSIEFKMNFLRPVLGDLGPVEAVATPVKRGRTVAVASVDVRQAGKLCAMGVFTYLVMDVDEAQAAG
jgi:uncharacterized protein (TIGR00369 family)